MVSTTMVSVSPGLQEAAGLHGLVKAVEGLSGSQRECGEGKEKNLTLQSTVVPVGRICWCNSVAQQPADGGAHH